MWELGHKEGWAPKYWWFWTGEVEPFFELLKLDKTLKSSLDTKEIKPLNPQGNQPWIFIGQTDAEARILWRPDGRADSLQKTLMLGKIEGRRRRGHQRTRWLDGITNLMNVSLSKLRRWWWTGKPGMLQSMGSQRVGHNQSTRLTEQQGIV